jgi:hypothetical protein
MLILRRRSHFVAALFQATSPAKITGWHQENGHRKRMALQPLSQPPQGRAVLNIQGGPYVHPGVHDVDFVCGICRKVVASVPDKIRFMSDSGPAIFVCYASGAYNEAL